MLNRQDEVGVMVQALHRMQKSLREVLGTVRQEADNSAEMAAEVYELVGAMNGSAQDMSAVTEEMAASMEETALVIIDIDDAIANGYVKLTKVVEDLIAEDDGGESDGE